ncbi:hypothetical protein TWF106_008006 [Orbilia oligospora]|uniref:Major facilitator superfamily (MFS) profile domain-containing protein n=1 Tax=Orbilia oligospora TaxID=2813651 RepID=A0A7C8QMK3_ORBOL|nr:hypothetical protein TWF106_008006 [Orbilia oligospora]KAF3219917.1 hypothetical protein TWF679_010373 [Orbilia oligospora]
MKWYNNPIVNPFYRDERDEAPEVIEKTAPTDEKSSPTTKEGNVQTAVAQDPEKGSAPQFISESVEDLNNSDFQFGIKKVEAIATIWSKKELYLLYACSFNSHSLISTSAVVASIVGGVLRLPIGKVIDIWGRAEGFVIFAIIFLIGLVMLAATDGVATYAAASFLQVVFNLDVTQAGYVGNIYSIGSTFWAIVVGYLIRRTNRYKWIGVLFVPVHILGAGLMIHFRQPWQSIGFVIMCQIFIAFAGGSLVICHEIAGLAVGTHADIAMILALLYLAAAIGGAMGSSVSGAIWQNTFPELLFKALPAELKGEVANIVYSLPTQLSYPPGSPGRDAIVYAYGVAQQRMCIAATAMASVTLVGVWMWRDIRLDNKKQVKGTVL